jgi:hypothetical protein
MAAKVSAPDSSIGSEFTPPPSDYSLLGRFYPYAVPGAVQGSQEYKMKEAEDYLAYPLREMESYHLHKHRSSPLPEEVVTNQKLSISPSGLNLIYSVASDKTNVEKHLYSIKYIIASEEDRILLIRPESHKSTSPIHWLSTGDIFYIVNTEKEFRLDFYDARTNLPLRSENLRNIDPDVGKEIATIIDVSIPWKEILAPRQDQSINESVYLSNILKPEFLVTVVGKYLIVLRLFCLDIGEDELLILKYYTYKLDIDNVQTRLFVNSNQTIDVYVEGGKRMQCPILTCDLQAADTVELLNLLIEDKQPPAGDVLFGEFRNAIDIYDSNTVIKTNQSYHMVKDNDHFLVSRPEGENVLKIRRFRATVGSLTLEGEYIVPCPSTPGNENSIRVDLKGNIVAVGDTKALIVYLLKDKPVQKIAEYAYQCHAMRILSNGLVACVLKCPRNDIITFRNYFDRNKEGKESYCRVSCQGRDKCFISAIPDSPNIAFQRLNPKKVNRKVLNEFGLTHELITGQFKLFVDDKNNFSIAIIENSDNGTKYILEWRKYNEENGWKNMSLDISEYFKEEIEQKIKVDFKTYCWMNSVILVWKSTEEWRTKIFYLTLEEKVNSFVIQKESIFTHFYATWEDMRIVDGHFWMVGYDDRYWSGIEDVSVLCVDLNKGGDYV